MSKRETVERLVFISIDHFNGDIPDKDEANVHARRCLTKEFNAVLSKYRKPKNIVAQRYPSPNNKRDVICKWKDTGHGEYTTSCGNEYHLWHLYEENRSLEEAKMCFCPFCGGKLTPVS